MSRESSKARERRLAEGYFSSIFLGSGIDIGCGDDPVTQDCVRWDRADGDAQSLEGVLDASFDWVYSSHCLEHLVDPEAALARWWEIVRPGGKMLVVVPDEDLYEQGVWPSRFNHDHKWTFTIHKDGSWSPRSLNLAELASALPDHKVLWIRLIDAGYEHGPAVWDRTLGTAEANLELLVQKIGIGVTASSVATSGSTPSVQSSVAGSTIFRHSGKLGDVVYSLPAIKAMGGGRLLLSVTAGSDFGPSQGEALRPLLELQPYIESVSFDQGGSCDHNLDAFRYNNPGETNLADCHLQIFGLPSNHRDEQWLIVDEPNPTWPVLFARSRFHHGSEAMWPQMYQEHGHRAAFVGTEHEHACFELEVGKIPYQRTGDLLELARLIAGCELFVGNQSCPYAIAEGLKVRTVQETDPRSPNCIFERPGAQYIGVK